MACDLRTNVWKEFDQNSRRSKASGTGGDGNQQRPDRLAHARSNSIRRKVATKIRQNERQRNENLGFILLPFIPAQLGAFIEILSPFFNPLSIYERSSPAVPATLDPSARKNFSTRDTQSPSMTTSPKAIARRWTHARNSFSPSRNWTATSSMPSKPPGQMPSCTSPPTRSSANP